MLIMLKEKKRLDAKRHNPTKPDQKIQTLP